MQPLRLLFAYMLILTGLLAGGAKAQNTSTITLTWKGYEQVLPVANLPGKVPSFTGASIDYAERLPYYRLQLPNLSINNFQLQHPVYEPFSQEDQKLFRQEAIGESPAIYILHGRQNKVPVSMVSILPVRRNPQSGQLEKLVRFSYTYTSAQTNATQSTRRSKADFSSNSVLSTGDWYKLAVTSSGIHKIDKAMLQSLGINTTNLNPKTIQLFGNAGGMLPQANNAPRPDDLTENAIWVAGEADGRFDDADHILFYAQGPHTWKYDATDKLFRHELNVYSDTAYYFLRVGAAPGARIATRAQAAGAAQSITTYNERLYHERDQKNMVYSGREWYGEEFSSFSTTREFSFPVSDIVPGSEIKLTAFLMANSPADCSFTLKLNNQALGTQNIGNRGNYPYHPEGVNSIKTYSINQQAVGQSADLKVTLQFNPGASSTSLGYLNYLELNLERQLKLYGEQTAFRSLASMAAPVGTFRIAGAPATAAVWDVTNPLQPIAQQTTYTSDLSFTTSTDVLREFLVFQNGSGLKPVARGKVANQNLHALNQNGDLDFVILTHPGFLQEANRLAAHRSSHSNMQVAVVTTTQVYNEFSSGAQDVTAIRNFMRMLYSRSNKSNDNIMYLLLFGDASYDYKNRLNNNTNFVPTYQSRESLHPITSYSSEDYYGFLDEEEGEWAENSSGDHLLDIGIGRLPAKTPTEAATLVDKIIAYDSPNHFGKWRSRITLVSDDGDYNEHQDDAEFLANYVESEQPKYNPNKVYLDLFPQQVVANGQRSAEASAAVEKAVEQGSLLINYTGHGNEVSWASEQILTLPQINNWRNKDRLTFLLTATCEFGRYDDPSRASGAEQALLNAQGGAVGLITTTRPVYSNGNRVLNRNFFKHAFTPINDRMPRLGDLAQRTKNSSITDNASGSRGVNNRNFTLLSDPSMELAYPDLQANITHVNGKAAGTDTLQALSKVTLAGKVATAAGAVESSFNGILNLTVFDKQTTGNTLGDEGARSVPVKLRESIIYDGQATVTNGLFEVTFVVPKDITYTYGTGKINLYASNQTTDAMGATNSILVGGTAAGVAADNTPPTIELFMDNESFVFGGNTSKNPILLAKLFDENGINTAGIGIGHEITATLDEGRENPITLNDYYTSEMNSYQSGSIKYNLKDLDAGPHSLRLKAWDTHNNSAEEYIEFIVSNDARIALEHVLNYPNPFSTKTTFHFDHNRSGENLDIQIQIFTVTGKLVKTLETTTFASTPHVAELTWDGKDEFNDALARGAYIYKVNVRSQQDGAKTSKFEKLVILK
ncbi:type IX secretion system sortase PorU [Pontibacter ruber]|uniref:Type IX secretion system sortase PorU n=1 Tax=Pontibacter ruber TaxID=1343895 RepID=A0ABW5D1E3_9BACT|nr:type IX secretion system sortase PorU [Pontibacter ruber]